MNDYNNKRVRITPVIVSGIVDNISTSETHLDEVYITNNTTDIIITLLSRDSFFRGISKIFINKGVAVVTIRPGTSVTLNGLTGANGDIILYPNESCEIISNDRFSFVSTMMTETPFPKILTDTNLDFSALRNGQVVYQDISANTTYTFSNRVAGKKIELSILNTSASDVTVDFSEGVVIADSNIIPAGKEAIVSIIAVRASYRIGIAIQS